MQHHIWFMRHICINLLAHESGFFVCRRVCVSSVSVSVCLIYLEQKWWWQSLGLGPVRMCVHAFIQTRIHHIVRGTFTLHALAVTHIMHVLHSISHSLTHAHRLCVGNSAHGHAVLN